MAYLGVSNEDCPGNIKLWLMVQAVICLIHILMTRHVFYLFQQPYDPSSTGKDKDIESRTTFLLCNDPAAALYILTLIGGIGWLCIGSAWTTAAPGCDLNTFVVLAQVSAATRHITACITMGIIARSLSPLVAPLSSPRPATRLPCFALTLPPPLPCVGDELVLLDSWILRVHVQLLL